MDRGGRCKERQQSVWILCQRPLRPPPNQGDLKMSMDGRQRGQQPSPSRQNTYPEERVDQEPSRLAVCESRLMEGHQTFGEIFNGQLTDDSGTGEVEMSKLVLYSCRTAGWSCSYCLAITQLVGDKSTVFTLTTRMKKAFFFCASSRMQLHTLPRHYSCLTLKILNPQRSVGSSPSPSTHVLAPRPWSRPWESSAKHQGFNSQATEMQLWWPGPWIYAFWNRNSLSLSQCCAYPL